MQIADAKAMPPITQAQNQLKPTRSQTGPALDRKGDTTRKGVQEALDEIVLAYQLERGRQPRVDVSSLLEGQKTDPYSGDFTDVGGRLSAGILGPVDLDRAVLLHSPIHITDSVRLSKEEQLDKLRKEGLPKQIDWFKVERDFSIVTDVLLTDRDANPEETISYYASKYVALRTQISTDFAGDEQKTQLDQLDRIFHDSTETYARNLAQVLGGFFEEGGKTGETETIYHSVRESLQNKVSAFTLVAERNPVEEKLEASQDAWLSRSSDYRASQLRAAAGQENEPFWSESKHYTADGLGTLFKFAMGGVHLLRSSLSGTNESDTGVRAGVMLLEAQAFLAHSTVPDDHKNALQNKLLSKISRETGNPSTVNRIVKEMSRVYQTTKNVADAVDAGLQMGTGTSTTRSAILQSMRNLFDRLGVDATVPVQKNRTPNAGYAQRMDVEI